MKIKRRYFNKLYAELKEPHISILLGARQVGKTTLLQDLCAKAAKEGFKTRYFDLESSDDLLELSGNNRSIVKTLTDSGKVIFIDEFHYLKNASKIFKEIYDSRKMIKIYASGSSSLEIHRHLKESLAGRFRTTMIFPLTRNELGRVFDNNLDVFFRWGGMPGLLHRSSDEDKIDLLKNIVSTYITKDIKAIIKEENVRAFNQMIYMIAQNQGSLAVMSNIANETGISQSTVADYLEIMSQTYVSHQVHSYSTNLANELKKSKKCYLFDIGIRNSVLKDFRNPNEREDKGLLNETFVFLNMIPQLLPNMEIRFWRTKRGDEVDFILIKNRVPVPIEVKSKLKDFSIPTGMKAFLRAYPKAPFGIVFNETQKGSGELDGRTVYFQKLEESEDIEYLQTVL